jgi:sortase (surface protein transpeptidase)
MRRRGGGRRRLGGAALALAFLLGTASCAGAARSPGPPSPPASATTAPAATSAPAGAEQRRAATPARSARPVQVAIPSIGVAAPLVGLGLTADRRLEVPEDYAVAGWYTGGPEPGQPGPAVIAGHVDSKRGPAVFYRLVDLRRGDRVVVRYSDGTVVAFLVEHRERHPKQAFPTARVYGRTDGPALRLITCGGSFDRASGHYRDNLIVFARPAASP